MASTNTLRTAMIEAAEQQLAASSDHDVATRAVCEAVGVTQPVLYRLFGDKRGLLDAVADHGYERYAARKCRAGNHRRPGRRPPRPAGTDTWPSPKRTRPCTS
ncbi:TetR/AcrR family transcriptional regulator [Yinghuangia aomiensis]